MGLNILVVDVEPAAGSPCIRFSLASMKVLIGLFVISIAQYAALIPPDSDLKHCQQNSDVDNQVLLDLATYHSVASSSFVVKRPSL